MSDGRPYIAIGTPGGRTIQQTTPQMLTNLIDFDMDVQQAIAEPRISTTNPNALLVEPGIPESVRGGLASLGHNVRVDERGLGNAHGLTIEYDAQGRPTRFTGGADPRGVGAAAGYWYIGAGAVGSPEKRDHYNYWLAPTFRASGGRYLRRLPDRTLVYADQYEERLRKYAERPKPEPVARPAGALKFYSE